MLLPEKESTVNERRTVVNGEVLYRSVLQQIHKYKPIQTGV